jgi:signal transduction histidine kinase
VETEAARAPSRAALLAIAVAGVLASVVTVVLRLGSDHGGSEPGLHAALLAWITISFVFSGLVAWWRRPESRLGPLMMLAGFLTSLSALSLLDDPLPFTVGMAMDLVPFPLFLHVFLAFPTGRLESTVDRALVGVGYFAAVGLQVVGLMLGGFSPDNVLAVVSEPAAAETLFEIQLLTIAATSLAGIGALIARRRASGPPLRRSLALLVDSFVLALVMIAILGVTAVLFPEWGGFLTVQRIMFFAIGLAPLVFLVGLLDARLGRSAVGDLMIELRANSAPGHLPAALGRALHDPSLQLAYWLPQFDSWSDADGRGMRLPGEGEAAAATLIEHDGQRVAAIIHDPALREERELLEAVCAAAEMALENGRLHAELRAGLDEVRGSRERVLEAGQEERKRLERNLHDGAQQRLIALSLDLARLGGTLEDPDAEARIASARGEIAASLDELRDVARGLHPAVLSGHGLRVALESLAASSAVPVRLQVTVEERLEEPVEVAAFYVVSESLANVGKHARARSATVDVERSNGQVVVEVVDDGIGGADSERGSGIRGLADRVEALGGRLRVWTPQGGGTRVRAEMPCA